MNSNNSLAPSVIPLLSSPENPNCVKISPTKILFLYNDGFLGPSIKRITQIEAFKKILPQIKLSKVFTNKKYLESISILIDSCVLLEVHIVKNVDQNAGYILDYLSQIDLEKDNY